MPPQFPMQGRMGSQMMGSLFGRGRMGMNQISRFPMMGSPQQINNGGGLLSRLLGRGPTGGMNPSNGMNGLMGMQQAGRAAGGNGSFMQSLTNPGGISSFLNNTQQVLKTAQSIGPMVQQFQQYSSLIRNFPAMWKLLQAWKNAPSDEEESNHSTESKSKTSSTDKESISIESSSSQVHESSTINPQKTKKKVSRKQNYSPGSQIYREKGASVPKLYI